MSRTTVHMGLRLLWNDSHSFENRRLMDNCLSSVDILVELWTNLDQKAVYLGRSLALGCHLPRRLKCLEMAGKGL